MSSAPRLLYVVLFLQTQENGLWQDVRSFRRIQPHVFGILPLSPDSAPNFVPGGLVFIGQKILSRYMWFAFGALLIVSCESFSQFSLSSRSRTFRQLNIGAFVVRCPRKIQMSVFSPI